MTANNKIPKIPKPPSDVVNPAALSVTQLARMMAIPNKKVQEHLDAGAPTNADGKINLIHYAAWLNLKLTRTDGN